MRRRPATATRHESTVSSPRRIDTEPDTRGPLIELLYCVQRDVGRRWRSRSRGWRFVAWLISAATTSATSVAADHHLNLLVQLLRSLGQI